MTITLGAIARTVGIAVLLTTSASAQVITGTILGTVTDSSGAPVSGTPVVLRNVGTNITTRTVTNNSGEYTVPLLPPGAYEVSIELAGFKAFRQTNVNVGV